MSKTETPAPETQMMVIDPATIDRIAAAIDRADVDHSMRMTRLVDGVSTYRLDIDGQTYEFVDSDDASATEQVYARIREVKQRKQAEMVIAALSPGEPLFRGFCDQLIAMFDFNKLEHSVCDEDMELVEHIRAALSAEVEG